MSTTVIASRHDMAGLLLAPWRPRAADIDDIRRRAAAHGVDLFDASVLNDRLEAIVASGLEPGRAARLAADLREAGLTVRVVNDPTITESARLSNALFALILGALFTAPLVLPALLAVVNALVIVASGLRLPMIGAREERPDVAVRVLDRLRSLRDELPAHVVDPLVSRAERLASEATGDPDGPAVRALEEILHDLQSEQAAAVADDGRALRQELARARQAAREVG